MGLFGAVPAEEEPPPPVVCKGLAKVIAAPVESKMLVGNLELDNEVPPIWDILTLLKPPEVLGSGTYWGIDRAVPGVIAEMTTVKDNACEGSQGIRKSSKTAYVA